MTLMTDSEIHQLQQAYRVVTPYFSAQLQPCSYDVTLGNVFLTYESDCDARGHIDIHDRSIVDGFIKEHHCEDAEYFVLSPGYFTLGSTSEYVSVPDHVAVRFEGKSTLGRFGLATHITAGFIDPGFSGQITVELKNNGPLPIRLTPGMAIGQLCFERLHGSVRRPYGSVGLGSHYQFQLGPTAP